MTATAAAPQPAPTRAASDPFAVIRAARGQQLAMGPQALLSCLAGFSNRDGVSWPSQATLAEACGTTVRTVRRWLAVLVAAHLVTVEASVFGPRRRRNRYHLHLDAPAANEDTRALFKQVTGDLGKSQIEEPPQADTGSSDEDPPPFDQIQESPVEQAALFTAPQRPRRPRAESDNQRVHREVFATLLELWPVHDTMTPSEQGQRHRLTKEMCQAGATASEVHTRFGQFVRRFGWEPATPRALAKHWGECALPAGWDPVLGVECRSLPAPAPSVASVRPLPPLTGPPSLIAQLHAAQRARHRPPIGVPGDAGPPEPASRPRGAGWTRGNVHSATQ